MNVYEALTTATQSLFGMNGTETLPDYSLYASNIGLVLLSMFLFVIVTYTAFNLLTLLHYTSAKLTIRLIHKRTRSQRRSLELLVKNENEKPLNRKELITKHQRIETINKINKSYRARHKIVSAIASAIYIVIACPIILTITTLPLTLSAAQTFNMGAIAPSAITLFSIAFLAHVLYHNVVAKQQKTI